MKFLPFEYYMRKVKDPQNLNTISSIKSSLKSSYFLLFGVQNLHSHIRYRRVKPQIKNLKTLDVEAGYGYFSFSLVVDGLLRGVTICSYGGGIE